MYFFSSLCEELSDEAQNTASKMSKEDNVLIAEKYFVDPTEKSSKPIMFEVIANPNSAWGWKSFLIRKIGYVPVTAFQFFGPCYLHHLES